MGILVRRKNQINSAPRTMPMHEQDNAQDNAQKQDKAQAPGRKIFVQRDSVETASHPRILRSLPTPTLALSLIQQNSGY